MAHTDPKNWSYISFERLPSLASALVSTEDLCALSRSDPLHLRSVVLLLSGAFTLATCIALRQTDGTGIYDKDSEKALRAYHNHRGYNDGNPAHGSPVYPENLRLAAPKKLWARVRDQFGISDSDGRVEWFFDHMRNNLEHPKEDHQSIEYGDFLASTLAVAIAIRDCLKLDDVTGRHRDDPNLALATQAASAIISFLRDNPPDMRLARPPLSDEEEEAIEMLIDRDGSRSAENADAPRSS